ncbi:hypothetical protein [Rhizorhabdus dicambivorans]|uniref:Uncharacterized protein n=1 Tax=Rhizorhabdus dicambivorans TaxID=1850238 RepID=A0A2A4FM41_9SPHN|nr:hypothetical protein [Rhizorhabdus dicambivorans]PCE39815.1 hypothetical protein COO09_23490 [Rhizorhabdus dicambivorans]
MKAVEKAAEVRAAAAQWQKAFRDESRAIGKMDGQDVLWHERLQFWASFGRTKGRNGALRDWNAFGQKPLSFRSNMIVEINQPPRGIDRNLQAVFARDGAGHLWVLHQGRMSVSGSRVTEADFIAATGLQPVKVAFSDGSHGAYHPVARIDGPAALMAEGIGAFIAQCAHARNVKLANGMALPDLEKTKDWEHRFSPEAIGSFEIAAQDARTGNRWHGEIQRALAGALADREVPHSNDRVGQYGPDLFTYGPGPSVLFEIKSGAGAQDIFAAVGQLHIYDHLLGGGYRKVLVVPKGMGAALKGPVAALKIDTVEFHRAGRKIVFDEAALSHCLGQSDFKSGGIT